MKYLLPTLFLAFACTTAVTAQETYNSSGSRITMRPKKQESKGFDKDKLIYGGGFTFNFFGGAFRAGAAPVLGYRFHDRFIAGIALGYQYDSQKDYFRFSTNSGVQYRSLRRHMVMPSVWVRGLVFSNIFIHAEAEYDIQNWRGFTQDPANLEPVKIRETYKSPAVLVGPGLRQPLGDYSSLYVMVLYDVVQDPYSPYRGLLDYRIGFNLGW